MILQQQFFEPQLSPTNIYIRSFNTQRLSIEPKDISPWQSQNKKPSPRDFRTLKKQSSFISHVKKQNNTTVNLSSHSEQIVMMRRFKTHVFEFIDQSKISHVHTLQKEKKPYTFKSFQVSSFLPEQKQSCSKNPVEPVFISLLKYKKQKLKNRIKEIACRLTSNKSKSICIPSLSNRELLQSKSRIISLGYQKANFKITTKANKFQK